MKMSIRSLCVAAFAALFFGTAAQADYACIQSCQEGASDCLFDSREVFNACLEESACEEARDDFFATCLVADRDVEACSAARDAFRTCVKPCRADLRDDVAFCRDEGRSCIETECGEDHPLTRFLHFQRK